MTVAKLIVIYPRPKDLETFEKVYQGEHVPLAMEKLKGKTKIISTRTLDSPLGEPPFHTIAEVHFPSMEALHACATSNGGRETLAHAIAISSGGHPIFLVAEESVYDFDPQI